MRTIAVINQKGGVGKTTTVVNLAAAIASAGRDICAIDLDPQSHLTLSLGVEPGTPKQSMYDVLTADAPLDQVVVEVAPHLHLAPAEIDLAAAEVELVGAVGREQILRDRLAEVKKPYEFVMIDCPPSLGLLTLNALAAADDVLIPLQPHFLALQGLGKLLETVSLVQRRINPTLRVCGVILCMYETSTRLAGEVVADLHNFFQSAAGSSLPWSNARIFDASIRRNVKLAECPSYGKTIFQYEPRSNGAADYQALANEFFRMYDLPAAAVVAAQAAPAVSPAAQPGDTPPPQSVDQPPTPPQISSPAGGDAPVTSAPIAADVTEQR